MGEKLIIGGSLMHADRQPDFSGYATKAGIRCSDGRTITPDAFKHQDKATVPLVWQHNHADPTNVLGHAVLEHRDDGVYAYGYFNDTDQAKNAKVLVQHDDIKALSIFANQLLEKSSMVMHGFIRELSLVLAGANPGALIDNISMQHGDDVVTIDDEAIIYTGLNLEHAGTTTDNKPPAEGDVTDTTTVQEVYDSLTPEQQEVVHYMVGAALAVNGAPSGDAAHSGIVNQNKDKEGIHMTRNAFEQNGDAAKSGESKKPQLSHDDVKGIVADAVKCGSLKEAVQSYALKHGIDNIDVLFPDARSVDQTPQFDSRRMGWVQPVLDGTKHSPFSRIKSLTADITMDEARALGYIKGNMKKEEFFSITKRTTAPTTVYKKQKLDRDDIIDITDFSVVTWMQGEMRIMLNEELARAVLIGDGRDVEDDDKIKDPSGATDGTGIRSILNDNELYAATVNINLAAEDSSPSDIVDSVVSAMKYYKGTGSPTFYTTLPVVTQLLLARDTTGRRLYANVAELAAEMTVAEIVAVEVMETIPNLVGIIVNLADYTMGTDQGGEINMFDFFDIDYNQNKYLIETRVSGALTKIRSALIINNIDDADAVLVTPVEPGFAANVVTPATTTHITYYRADTDAVVTTGAPITLDADDLPSITIYAVAASGYYIDNDVDDNWTFVYSD